MLVDTDNLIRWRVYAHSIGVPERTVFNWIVSGRLPAFLLDGFYYVARDAQVKPKSGVSALKGRKRAGRGGKWLPA